jgi:hypothetical protein
MKARVSMTKNRRTRCRGAWTTLAMTGLLLQGCASSQTSTSAGSGTRVFSADVTGGAKSCEAPRLSLDQGQAADAQMKVGNDGGWCGLVATQNNGKPFDAGLLTSRPAHGTVLIHRVGDVTRTDYTPDRGFTGADAFGVKLIPGDASIRISVAVTAAR